MCDTIQRAKNTQIGGIAQHPSTNARIRGPFTVESPDPVCGGRRHYCPREARGQPAVGLTAGVADFDGQILWSLAVRRAAEGLILGPLYLM